MRKEAIWHLIMIKRVGEDKDAFRNILKLLETNFEYKFITMDEFEGAGVPGLFYHMREIISTDRVFQFKEVYSILEQVEQFDWVDFFLFEKFPDGWTTQAEKMDSHFLIKCSDLLVRGVDNCYIFIYTPNEKVIEIIKIITRILTSKGLNPNFWKNFVFHFRDICIHEVR